MGGWEGGKKVRRARENVEHTEKERASIHLSWTFLHRVVSNLYTHTHIHAHKAASNRGMIYKLNEEKTEEKRIRHFGFV